MTFENGNTLNISPKNTTKVGIYLMTVELSDGYCTPNIYFFKVQVNELTQSAQTKISAKQMLQNMMKNSSFEIK